jgi:hypothetical protein
MRAGYWVLGVVATAGCGSVDNKNVDARNPDTGQQADTAIMVDAPPTVVTAIDASNIAAFTATTNAYTKVPYESVSYDDETELANGTFTPKIAGDYFICASLRVPAATFITLDIYKNAARDTSIANGIGTASGCTIMRLAAGDAVDVRLFQNQGSNLAVTADANWQWLTISRVSSTAYTTSTTTLPLNNTTYTKAPFTNEIYDDTGQFSGAMNRFTPAQAGDYEVCASYYYDFGAYIPGQMDAYVNGARDSSLSFGRGALGGCRTLRLALGDYLEVFLYQSSGTNQTIASALHWDWVVIARQPATVSLAGITGFSVTANGYAKVLYSAERFDDSGQFDVGTSTFTAAAGGDYRICASLYTGTTADGDELFIYKNGTREKALDYGQFAVGGCRVMRLAAADQVQIYVHSGANTFGNSTQWSWFEASKLR